MHLFCCANISMTDDIYNSLENFMSGLKTKISHINQPRGESCNRSKCSLSLGMFKKCVIFLFPLTDQIVYLCNVFKTIEWYLMDWHDGCVHYNVDHLE